MFLNKTAVAVVLAAGLCGGATVATIATTMADHHQDHAKDTRQKNLVETAEEAGSFKHLVAAVKAAGLVEVLTGEGPLTVFAPTDEAFEALPDGTLDNLLKPENREQLRAVLTYHVVSGRATAEDVKDLDAVQTVNGAKLKLSSRNGTVRINDSATVVKADVHAGNGVIHVIDQVLIP
jgi:uncharacterized surface protein with fasciclin (FAS1) repeats